MKQKFSPEQQAMIDMLDKHVNAELDGDLETTMATMTDNPHLLNVPNLIGGTGKAAVQEFYASRLVGKFFPPDVVMTSISKTVSDTQIVDELVISFTHTTEIAWMLPGIAPTGKPVKLAFCVVAGIRDGKISHEHIYWDQASAMVQLGLIDPGNLPVYGAECAEALLRTLNEN